MSAVETVSIEIKVFGDFPEYYIVQTPFPAVPEHGVARGLPGAPHGQLWFRVWHPTAASAARPPRIAETQPGNGQAAREGTPRARSAGVSRAARPAGRSRHSSCRPLPRRLGGTGTGGLLRTVAQTGRGDASRARVAPGPRWPPAPLWDPSPLSHSAGGRGPPLAPAGSGRESVHGLLSSRDDGGAPQAGGRAGLGA